VLALVAFARAQVPQLASLVLFALATSPWLKDWNPWPALRPVAGFGSAALGFYTMVVTGYVLVQCMLDNEPGDPTDFWLLMRFALSMEGFVDLVAGALSGYLLGDLDVFSGAADPVFVPWGLSPAHECPSPEQVLQDLAF
jgi:hypothetical protein